MVLSCSSTPVLYSHGPFSRGHNKKCKNAPLSLQLVPGYGSKQLVSRYKFQVMASSS